MQFLQISKLAYLARYLAQVVRLEARCEGEQCNVPRLLDGQAKTTLMPGADSGQTARNNLAALRHKALQQANVSVGDRIDLLRAELANLLATEELAPARTTRATCRTGGTCAARAARARVGAGRGCVLLLGRWGAGRFVSHDGSLSITLCRYPLQTRAGVSEQSADQAERKLAQADS